jgi:hypothetical protein
LFFSEIKSWDNPVFVIKKRVPKTITDMLFIVFMERVLATNLHINLNK